jgi:hypothetical protein
MIDIQIYNTHDNNKHIGNLIIDGNQALKSKKMVNMDVKVSPVNSNNNNNNLDDNKLYFYTISNCLDGINWIHIYKSMELKIIFQ